MEKNRFTVIKGGLCLGPADSNKKFISAYVTDTRLMGVVGMYAKWKLSNGINEIDYHQFFYLDAEETGFETVTAVKGNNYAELLYLEHQSITGLGGEKIAISEEELRAILKSYIKVNKALGKELPKNKDDYEFLLEGDSNLLDSQILAKQCTKINTDYHAINYFLMRVFAKDFEAAAYLASGHFPLNLYPEIKASTLCKNSSKKYGDGYICESLVEEDDEYVIARSYIKLEENSLNERPFKAEILVSEFKRLETLKISPIESAMMLGKKEYVTCYHISPDQDFESDFLETEKTVAGVSRNSMASLHENGRLYIAFKANNKHVEKQVYSLNEDMNGVYFISNNDELILAAYSLKDIKKLEAEIEHTYFARRLSLGNKFQFKEPVLYEYMEGDFSCFEEFIQLISMEDD